MTDTETFKFIKLSSIKEIQNQEQFVLAMEGVRPFYLSTTEFLSDSQWQQIHQITELIERYSEAYEMERIGREFSKLRFLQSFL